MDTTLRFLGGLCIALSCQTVGDALLATVGVVLLTTGTLMSNITEGEKDEPKE